MTDQHSLHHASLLANISAIQPFLHGQTSSKDRFSFTKAAICLANATIHYSALVDELYATFHSRCSLLLQPEEKRSKNKSPKVPKVVMVKSIERFEAVELQMSERINLSAADGFVGTTLLKLTVLNDLNEEIFIPITAEDDEVLGKYTLKVNQWSQTFDFHTSETIYIESEGMSESSDSSQDLGISSSEEDTEIASISHSPTQNSSSFPLPSSEPTLKSSNVVSSASVTMTVNSIEPSIDNETIATVHNNTEVQDETKLPEPSTITYRAGRKASPTSRRRKVPKKNKKARQKIVRKRKNIIWDPLIELQNGKRRKSGIFNEVVANTTNPTEEPVQCTLPSELSETEGADSPMLEMRNQLEHNQDTCKSTPLSRRKIQRKSNSKVFDVEVYENEVLTCLRTESSKTLHVKEAFKSLGQLNTQDVCRYFCAILQLANKKKLLIKRALDSLPTDDWLISPHTDEERNHFFKDYP